MLNKLFNSLHPPKKELPSKFIRDNRYLSSEISATPGRWKDIPYQTEMLDVTEDDYTMVIFQTGSQVGKTEILKNILLYRIIKKPSGITWLLPSISLAREYSSAQLETLIRDNKILRDITPEARKDGASRLFKRFPGGFLRLVGAQKSDLLCSYPTPLLLCDEIDRMPQSARSSSGHFEGNPLLLILQRITNWPKSKRLAVFTSTPTLSGSSAIEEWFLKSDQRYPHVKCDKGHFNFLKWEGFHWKNKNSKIEDEEPKDIYFPCKECNFKFTDKNRYKWLPTVKWEKKKPKSEIAGFHINAFYSPWVSWKSLIHKWLDSKGNYTKEMVFFNTSLGRPYTLETMEKPKWESLFKKEKLYARGELPKGVSVILGSTDVQKDRLETVIVGWDRKKAYVLDYFISEGNSFDLEAECWQNLDDILTKKWGGIPIKAMSIDAQFNTTTVSKYSRSRSQIYPINGLDRWDMPVFPPKPMAIKSLSGKWFKTGKKRWPLGVSLLKADLYNRLKLDNSSQEAVSFCDGLPEEYFKQLVSEELQIKETKNGTLKHQWTKTYHANEALDTLSNNLGLHTILFGSYTEKRWKFLEDKANRLK